MTYRLYAVIVAACLAAEPVIEYSINGVVAPRQGNRCRGVMQGVYPTATEGEWVALTVREAEELARLAALVSNPDLHWNVDHDQFDDIVADWTQTKSPADLVNTLRAVGIPAEQVLTSDRMYDLPQLEARAYYQEVEHPLTGVHRYPGWPMRITPGPERHHRTPPPTLGQHNDEVLSSLGLTDDEIDDLREQRVIGDTALNA